MNRYLLKFVTLHVFNINYFHLYNVHTCVKIFLPKFYDRQFILIILFVSLSIILPIQIFFVVISISDWFIWYVAFYRESKHCKKFWLPSAVNFLFCGNFTFSLNGMKRGVCCHCSIIWKILLIESGDFLLWGFYFLNNYIITFSMLVSHDQFF